MKLLYSLTYKLLIFILLLIISKSSYAQTDDNKDNIDIEVTCADTSIQDTIFIIDSIKITGNIKTKPNVISKEIELNIGDTLSKFDLEETLERSKINLNKLSLFNYVNIFREGSVNDTDSIIYLTITFNVEERWYVWPNLSINPHNGNLNEWLKDPDIDKIDYCFGVKKYNFRGRKEVIILNFKRGFNNITELGYADIALDKNRIHFLSLYSTIKNQRQIVLQTENDEAYYKEFKQKKALYGFNNRICYTFRQTHHLTHNITLSYSKISICDSIALLNPNYLGKGRTQLKTMNVSYVAKFDRRSSTYYPLTGYYYMLEFDKYGFGQNEVNSFSLILDLRQYLRINSKFYVGFQMYANKCDDEIPYYLQPNIGTKPNILAGYEHNLIGGKGLTYLKTSYKFELIPQKIIQIKKINIPKFNKIHYALYLNMFANCGYVEGQPLDDSLKNTLTDTFLGAFGIGLDLVTYYDRILSLYVTRNAQNQHYLGVSLKAFF
ncbi:MAG: hypothetical protein MJ211_09065 [Bacteroidales bacterium]|nr:hypothetical protein [Bacteroidales bacterium]